jgi:hypothetical protein
MINFVGKAIDKIIQKRIEKVPATNILKDSFAMAGGIVGFIKSIQDVFKNENGFILRPFGYSAFGFSIGYVSGLYPFHCLGLLAGYDFVYYIQHQNKKK